MMVDSLNIFVEPTVENVLAGLDLDHAVAQALGLTFDTGPDGEVMIKVGKGGQRFSPSTDWGAAGLALDLARPIAIVPDGRGAFSAWAHGQDAKVARSEGKARSMMLAAMRCIAALGVNARA